MIVGVAIRNENIIVMLPKPNRHCDCFNLLEKMGVDTVKEGIGVKGKDQGFYTHTGRYLDRWEAWKHAKRCKQELMPNAGRGPLFSEDLWQD
jgi:hypothetical protein